MVDMTNDVTRFEEMFADRFTEKDGPFMELKSKSLSHPVVIHPWKTQKKLWNKRWDYSGNRKNQEDRGHRDRGSHRNDDRRDRQSSYDRNQDRSREGGNSKDRYKDRSRDREHSRDKYSERSLDGNSRSREKVFDYQAALKAYQQR